MRAFCLLPLALYLGLAASESSAQNENSSWRRTQEIVNATASNDGQNEARHLRRRNNTKDNRIVGGVNARAGEFPFNVLGLGCGGTLIAKDMVLSAAHCKGALGDVLIGANARSGGGSSQERRVVREVLHPRWQPSNMKYDMMVAKLNKPVTGSKLKVAQLNKAKNVPKPNAAVTAIGFGLTSEFGSVSRTLRKVTLRAVAMSKCKKQYRREGQSVDAGSMMCAGVNGGGKDTCQGDSGGPLLVGKNKVVGITSWGFGCADPDFSGVYAKVASAAAWIENQVCRLTSATKPAYCRNNRFLEEFGNSTTEEVFNGLEFWY